MKKITVLLLSAFLLAGCHTIRPSQMTEGVFMSKITKSPSQVGLVMDKTYRTYISKDRGSSLADPQTYYLGEAMAPLTQKYFEEAFNLTHTYDALPDASSLHGEKYVIEVQVLSFDNDLQGFDQEILFTLGARIHDSSLKMIKEVSAKSYQEGSFGLFSSDSDAAKLVSRSAQQAITNLIAEVKKNIPND